MLKRLHIHNLVLIDQAEVPFENGFNVLSGETGSGKSALIGALHLIAGERTDSGLIRRGAEKASVEAVFALDAAPLVLLFKEAGIEFVEGDELTLRRELSTTGKSRAFVNDQLVSLTFLKQLGEELLEMVGQHANQRLLNLEQHRAWLDLFGDLQEQVSAFGSSFADEMLLRKELEALVLSESSRLRELEICHRELEELNEACLKAGEDEELFQEYTLLANADERALKAHEIQTTLNQERGVLATLKRQRALFEQLVRIDVSLTEAATAFDAAVVELQEISWTLDRYADGIDHNPTRMGEVDERLALIDRLKRKYGATLREIESYRQKCQAKYFELQSADERIAELEVKLKALEQRNNATAAALTAARQKAAIPFTAAITRELAELNMPKAEFSIEITPQKRTRFGDDRIEFYLAPNVGERKIPVRESASGGELSRLMLGLQTLLAGKTHIPTLVFDEIDANIGGATATVIGTKMQRIAEQHQILCVTHFPQVAKCAHHHLQISKQEIEGRTVTHVTPLTQETRARELTRMSG